MKKALLLALLLVLISISASAGIIFEDDFEGWNDAAPNDSSLIWSPSNGSISSASNGKWCSSQQWNEYGLPDTQVISSEGRYNSQSVVGNVESRVQPSVGVISLLPDKTHDELYFRWYMKYDETWSWWPNQNGQKLARMAVGPADVGCTTLNDHIIPSFAWGRMVHDIWPVVGTGFYSNPEAYWYDYGPGKWILIEIYAKLNTVGQSNGILTSWINGKEVLHEEGVVIRNHNYNFANFTMGDNIIYTNAAGSSGVPWLPPEEKQIWFDDVKVSTNYIGPEPCKNGVEITPENVGTCYCGTSTPNPDCSTNTGPHSTDAWAASYIAPNPTACTGIVDSGYCNNGVWSPSGTSDTTPPSTPANLTATAAPSSQINLSWAASTDNTGVAGYRIERCTGASCTSFTQIATPTGTSYNNTGLSANTTYRYRVRAADAAGNLSNYSSIASAATPAAPTDTTPPTVSISSPSSGQTVSGTISVTANASDNVGVAGVQFKLDGSNLGNEDTSAPYSVSWNTSTVSNASHALTATARDASGNTATATTVNVTVNNTTSTDWTFCANEGQTCSFSGTMQVRFGANGTYAYGTYTNSVLCSNSVFGDPIYGVTKQCDYTTSTTICTENWSCTAWTSCVGGTQTRVCSDPNPATTNCPALPKPAETQSCSTPGAGVIFQDDFEGWNDAAPNDASLIWDKDHGSITTASAGKWCSYNNWSEYGLPDTRVISMDGRNNSGSYVSNIESRVQPSTGLIRKLTGSTYDNLYFRWYMKYDPTWSWWPNQNGQKIARLAWDEEGLTCTEIHQYLMPRWVWGQMVYDIWPISQNPIQSNPGVYWYDYGPGVWISMEVDIKLNTVGSSNGELKTWINGVQVLNAQNLTLRTSNTHINGVTLGDNIIYTNQAGSSGVPWLPPEEKQIWWDDFVISTNYIGPAACPNGTQITMENVGACYCGSGSPSPDSKAGIYSSGYCCNNSWQTTSCTPAAQCTVNIATPCTISLAGGTINSCTQQNLIYEYNANTTVNNTVNGLEPNKSYDIEIQNQTTGATQTKTVSTNSAGVLEFNS
ncbi:MAG: Ig-like domain-containing protein [Candidatus Diapherotrites archaeon]